MAELIEQVMVANPDSWAWRHGAKQVLLREPLDDLVSAGPELLCVVLCDARLDPFLNIVGGGHGAAHAHRNVQTQLDASGALHHYVPHAESPERRCQLKKVRVSFAFIGQDRHDYGWKDHNEILQLHNVFQACQLVFQHSDYDHRLSVWRYIERSRKRVHDAVHDSACVMTQGIGGEDDMPRRVLRRVSNAFEAQIHLRTLSVQGTARRSAGGGERLRDRLRCGVSFFARACCGGRSVRDPLLTT
mmetsp:Transcript_63609/g.176934  ORF Transcript_63609/g.176934 Transcript_63609/m.176934 type:complete len:245 (+) Transcript_63609:958-1692(+)